MGSTRMNLLFSIVKISAAAYLGLCLLVFLRQSSYVYYPSRVVSNSPRMLGLDYEDLRVPTEDGETIAGWWIPAAEGNAPTLLFSHGNAGNIGDRLGSIDTFHRMGLNVLIYDYRGFGESTGKPTEEGTYLDIMAVWNYLLEERGQPADRVVLFGRSLGGAITAWLATRVDPGAVVLESTFTSAADIGSRMFPFLPVRLLTRFDYNTRARITGVDAPVVIAHSPEDELVPYEYGRELYRLAPEPKLFLEIPGGHNFGGLDASTEAREQLRAFLERHLPAPE